MAKLENLKPASLESLRAFRDRIAGGLTSGDWEMRSQALAMCNIKQSLDFAIKRLEAHGEKPTNNKLERRKKLLKLRGEN